MFDPDYAAGRLVVRWIADASQFNAVMTGVEQRIDTFSARLGSFSSLVAARISLPLGLIGLASARAFAHFDQAINHTMAMLENTDQSVRTRMENISLSISSRSVTGPKDLAQSLFYLTTAGYSASQSMAILPVVEKFSVAGMIDMEKATRFLIDSQNALGLSSDNTATSVTNVTRIMDVLTRAGVLSNATIQELSESLANRAGAALRMVNKDMEEGVAVIAVYADQGVRGRVAGERLAIVLRDLQTASIRQAAAWDHYGVAVYNAAGMMLPMATIIQQLEERMEGLSDIQKRAMLLRLGFQDRSVGAVLPLIGRSEDIRGYEAALRSAAGSVERIYQLQLTSFSNQVKILWNNLVGMGIEIGRVLAPWIAKLNSLIMDGIKWWNELTKPTREFIIQIGMFLIIAGPLLKILGFVWALTMGIFASLAKLVWILALAGAAAYVFFGGFDKAKDMLRNVAEFLGFGHVMEWLTELWESFDEHQKAAITNLLTLVGAIIAVTVAFKILATIFAIVMVPLLLIKTVLVGFLFFLNPFTIIFGLIIGVIAFTMRNAENVTKAMDTLSRGLEGVWEVVSKVWEGVKNAISAGNLKLAFDIVVIGIQIAWLRLVDVLKEAWRDFVNTVTDNVVAQTIQGIIITLRGDNEANQRRLAEIDARETRVRGIVGRVAARLSVGGFTPEEAIRPAMEDIFGRRAPNNGPIVRAGLDPAGMISVTAQLMTLLRQQGLAEPPVMREIRNMADAARGLQPIVSNQSRVQDLERRLAVLLAQAGQQAQFQRGVEFVGRGGMQAFNAAGLLGMGATPFGALGRSIVDRPLTVPEQSMQAAGIIGNALMPLNAMVVGMQSRFDVAGIGGRRRIPGDPFDFDPTPEQGHAKFQQIELRRFMLEGPGGLAAMPAKKQDVQDTEAHRRLDRIISQVRQPPVAGR